MPAKSICGRDPCDGPTVPCVSQCHRPDVEFPILRQVRSSFTVNRGLIDVNHDVAGSKRQQSAGAMVIAVDEACVVRDPEPLDRLSY